MAKIFSNPLVKAISYGLFIVGTLGLVLCGVNIENVSKITTLISGSVGSVGAILIQVINSIKNKLPSEPKG